MNCSHFALFALSFSPTHMYAFFLTHLKLETLCPFTPRYFPVSLSRINVSSSITTVPWSTSGNLPSMQCCYLTVVLNVAPLASLSFLDHLPYVSNDATVPFNQRHRHSRHRWHLIGSGTHPSSSGSPAPVLGCSVGVARLAGTPKQKQSQGWRITQCLECLSCQRSGTLFHSQSSCLLVPVAFIRNSGS